MKRSIFVFCLFLLFSGLTAFSLGRDLGEGDKLYKEGKFLESIAVYEKVLEKNPGDYGALWRLSRSYNLQANIETEKSAKRKVLEKAVEYARRAIAADGNGFEGHVYLAQSLGKASSVVSSKEKVKNTYKIRDSARKAIELNPSHYKAYMLLGMWHRKVNGAGWMEKNLARMFFGGLPEASLKEAEINLKKSIGFKEDNIEVHYELALVYKKMKRKDEAVKELEKALRCTVKNKRHKEIKEKVARLLKKLD